MLFRNFINKNKLNNKKFNFHFLSNELQLKLHILQELPHLNKKPTMCKHLRRYK